MKYENLIYICVFIGIIFLFFNDKTVETPGEYINSHEQLSYYFNGNSVVTVFQRNEFLYEANYIYGGESIIWKNGPNHYKVVKDIFGYKLKYFIDAREKYWRDSYPNINSISLRKL